MNGLLVIFLLALVYVAISRVVMRKAIDRKFMEDYQRRMKELNKEFAEASKRKDVKKMEEIHERQKKELLPGMKKLMREQIKMLILIFVLFTAALYALNFIDPTNKDDLRVSIQGNGVVNITGDREGVWRIAVNENGRERGYIEVNVGVRSEREKLSATWGNSGVWVDKGYYNVGEPIAIHYENISKAELVADRGTRVEIRLGLPFLERIEGSYWVFIFLVVVLGLVESLGRSIFRRLSERKLGA